MSEDVWQRLINDPDPLLIVLLWAVLHVVIAIIRDVRRGNVGSSTGELEFDDPENISPADRVRKIQDDLGNPLK